MKRNFLLLLIFSLLLSCSKSHYDQPDLGGIYNKAARRSNDGGNAVIVIPGILAQD
jgi:hypothetical protein